MTNLNDDATAPRAMGDIASFTWVAPDLIRILPLSVTALRRFWHEKSAFSSSNVRQRGAALFGDLQRQMRQIRSALEMIGRHDLSKYVEALESHIQSIVASPESSSETAITHYEKAAQALTEFANDVSIGRQTSALALFTQYRQILEHSNSSRIHPADLWLMDWKWHRISLSTEPGVIARNPAQEANADSPLSESLESEEHSSAASLVSRCMERATQSDNSHESTFWIIGAAFFEAIARALVPFDSYVSLTSVQIRAQIDAPSPAAFPVDRLAKDALFFIMRASVGAPSEGSALNAVRRVYAHCNGFQGDYNALQFGRFDLEQLNNLKRRLTALSDCWTAWTSGDVSLSKAVIDHTVAVGDSLAAVNSESLNLVVALKNAVSISVNDKTAMHPALALEVATTILYLEAVYADLDRASEFMADHCSVLARRLSQVSNGITPEAIEPWMEELYRKRSERTSLGSVTNELRITLGAVEVSLARYKDNPGDVGILGVVAGHLSQLYGVFSVLGIQQAAKAVFKIREVLDIHLARALRSQPLPIKHYERIANSVSTLGFLIDLINYQIDLAKGLFVYDDAAGEIRYLNGRNPAAKSDVARNTFSRETVSADPPSLTSPFEPHNYESGEESVMGAQLLTPSFSADESAVNEDDIRLVFLDEAREVLAQARSALVDLNTKPSDSHLLLTVRRAFHTLKGGARMVGLEPLGEAAWAFEQLMNQWVDDRRDASPELLSLASQSVDALTDWVQCIGQDRAHAWNAETFQLRAKALLREGRVISFDEYFGQLPQQDAVAQALLQEQDIHFQRVEFNDVSHPSLDADPIALNSDAHNAAKALFNIQQNADGGAISRNSDVPAPHSMPLLAALNFPEEFFQVFLEETGAWAEDLWRQVQSWQDLRPEPDTRTAQALAHSIRGNSAAVGIIGIAELAEAIELGLERIDKAQVPILPHLSDYTEAAAALRAMVQTAVSDRSPHGRPDIVARLKAIFNSEDPCVQVPAVSVEHAADISFEPDFVSASLLPADGQALHVPDEQAPQASFQLSNAVNYVEPVDDDLQLDSQDHLDIDLLPFFQEEGSELLPALGATLRLWMESPSAHEQRAQALRLLHTFKGSSRLAGALRLGELAHRMESGIEKLPPQINDSAALDIFLTQFDLLQQLFDALEHAGAQAGGSPTPIGLVQPLALPPDDELLKSLEASQETPVRGPLNSMIRIRVAALERLIDEAGEIAVQRSRLETNLGQISHSLSDLQQTLDRLSTQLRELEMQADLRIQSRTVSKSEATAQFDPLEFDRFTRLQEISRMMAESVSDLSTVRRNVQSSLYASKEDLEQQGRQTRGLQRELMGMRLVEFEAIADRLYGVVRKAAKELNKRVTLDLQGGGVELDRGVLERMTPAFEHLLRNAVAHGIESPNDRTLAGKPGTGVISIVVTQEGNDIAVRFSDDGRGLPIEAIRAKALQIGLISDAHTIDEQALSQLLFTPGFSTSEKLTELSGRGIGMDVVLSDVKAFGGRIDTRWQAGLGTEFKLVLPLTTAVTQVLLVRIGKSTFGIPAGLVSAVLQVPSPALDHAITSGTFAQDAEQPAPFFAAADLLQAAGDGINKASPSHCIVMLRSAGQSLACHVDEMVGHRDVVVKNLGSQLSRLPGLAGITVLPTGEMVLIYNPVALASVYGESVCRLQAERRKNAGNSVEQSIPEAPLILVVDDALTVRRVIQRLLLREGYRVALANDGVHALEILEQQRPLMVLSDIEMPRMDGFELARTIRARAEWADLPIVMITSRIAQKHRDHAMALGVNHYLGKPYSEAQLLGLIRAQAQTASA